jgi:hypothetical protein
MNELSLFVLQLMPDLERRGRSFVPIAQLVGTAGLDRGEPDQVWIDILWELCDDGLLIAVADPAGAGRGRLVSVGLTEKGRAVALGRRPPDHPDGEPEL